MKSILKLEELAMWLGSIYCIYLLHFDMAWWAYILLFFTPDIGMMGYIVNPYVGAITYNLFHHKGIAILVGMIGIVFANSYLQFGGLILFSHSSFDRIVGYGLKYITGFKNTHLGKI